MQEPNDKSYHDKYNKEYIEVEVFMKQSDDIAADSDLRNKTTYFSHKRSLFRAMELIGRLLLKG